MHTLVCPHCDKTIELVGQKDLTQEYGLGPNPVTRLREEGEFPDPVLSFGNRNLWLREQAEKYLEEESRRRLGGLRADFEEIVAQLPEAEQTVARRMLAEEFRLE